LARRVGFPVVVSSTALRLLLGLLTVSFLLLVGFSSSSSSLSLSSSSSSFLVAFFFGVALVLLGVAAAFLPLPFFYNNKRN